MRLEASWLAIEASYQAKPIIEPLHSIVILIPQDTSALPEIYTQTRGLQVQGSVRN